MTKRIVRRNLDPDPCLEALHPLLQRVYSTRKVKTVDELDKTLEKLHPYTTLIDIDKAVALLVEAIMQNQRILIVGDFDADGATSTAVAIRALKSFGAKHIQFLVPNRFAFGYGLTPELVEASNDYRPELIVTVDNGIANHAGVKAAKDKGIRVLITDHHLPAATLPNADAIVNPNQTGDPFPSKHLAGVGVIFYVMLALRKALVNLNWFAQKQLPIPNMSRLLDIVALGTIADLVSLDHNNRILVHHGLRRIRSGEAIPGIMALLELSNRQFNKVQAADLGFVVASRLNAAGRLDDMSLGIETLICDDSLRAREMARILNQLNDERKSIEQGMQNQALNVLKKLSTTLEGTLPKGLCLYDETWHQGVIGILASRIKEKFNRPVIVFAPGQEEEIKGSARSIAGFHIRDALALIDAQYPNLILKFGGHAMAAGLTILRSRLEDFIQAFNQVVSDQITDTQLEHLLLSDGELTVDELNIEIATMLKDAGPWGQAFPEPIFDDTFSILEQRIVGDKHLKLRLAKGSKVIDAVSFFVDTQVWPNHRCDAVRAAYRLDINEFRGKKNVQLIIDYLEPMN